MAMKIWKKENNFVEESKLFESLFSVTWLHQRIPVIDTVSTVAIGCFFILILQFLLGNTIVFF